MVQFLLLILATFYSANATLGEQEKSVENVEAKLKAAHSKTQQADYTVYKLESNGITIKEYVTLDGKVFAVRWKGLSQPDLKTLFGAYYTEFENADKKRVKRRSHRSVSIRTSKIVVLRSGRMMDLHGLAYVPELVPPGINPKRLK